MKKGNKRNIFSLKSLVLVAIFLISSICQGFLISQLSGSKIEQIAYKIKNPYEPIAVDENNHGPYISIAPNGETTSTTFNVLFSTYYYNLNTDCVRQYIANNLTYELSEETSLNLKLYYQPTTSIEEELLPDGGHYVDYGLFCSYYASELLGNRGYLARRFNCDGFTFISDTVADKLVEKYHLQNEEDPYATIILNEEYAVLPVKVDNDRTIKLCINSILYSDKRHAPHIATFGENFGLVYLFNNLISNLNVRFDVDIKLSQFAISSVLSGIRSAGFTSNEYSVSIYSYNKAISSYQERVDLRDEYISIAANYDVIIIVLYLVWMFVILVTLYFICAKWKEANYNPLLVIAIMIVILALYSLVGYLLCLNYFIGFMPIVLMMMYILFEWEEVKSSGKRLFKKQNKNS